MRLFGLCRKAVFWSDAMFQKAFIFKKNPDTEYTGRNGVNVSEKLYTSETGYGFVTVKNRAEQELLQIPAITSGFIPTENPAAGRLIPVMFRADVPHSGNYRVEVNATNDGQEALIFLERRRLYSLEPFSGTMNFSFTCNVCDIIPEHKERIYRDSSLDIAWAGEGLTVNAVEIREQACPTIFIAGDSTVTDQPADYPYSPGTSYSGWGQMLSAYLNDTVAVSNHAHSGLTTESFRKEGHYSIISKDIAPGDYFFMQFGHNDQKLDHLRQNTGYRENLIRYIDEIRERGAFPVIVTSLARNTWFNNGEAYNDLLKDYAEECLVIGREYDVPVLDLHRFSMELVMREGLEESRKYYFPGDLSHTNDFGAYLMAGYIASEMKRVASESKVQAYKLFASMLRTGVSEWKIDPERLKLPAAEGQKNPAVEEPYRLKMDRLSEIIKNR